MLPKQIVPYVYEQIKKLADSGVQTGIIGYSHRNNPIYYIKKGAETKPPSMIFGAIHGREYVTAHTVLRLAQEYAGKSAIYFVPLLNPDGVIIATNGFSDWKANGAAVDLNVNFDADWGTGKSNVFYPAPANYVGPYPESEPETQAIVNFTKKHDFSCTLCYHCKGEVIYYGYDNIFPNPKCASLISQTLNYPLEQSVGSAGGYKDWFTKTYHRLSLTIEVGHDDFSYSQLFQMREQIYLKNKEITQVLDCGC